MSRPGMLLLACVLLPCAVTVTDCGSSSSGGGTGGSPSGGAGGSISVGSGGVDAGGGPAATGGVPGAGGSSAGGSMGTGGSIGTGGSMSTGGSSGTGGTTGNGGGGGAGPGGGAAGMDGAGNGKGGGSAGGGRGGVAGSAGKGGTPGTGGAAGAGQPPDAGVDAVSIPGSNNPVLPGLNADPQIALFDGVFYIYPTTDGFANWTATSFSVFSSTNLVEWINRGVILDLAKDLTWATDRAWAPGIVRVGSTYYFYFSAGQQIGVAASASPTGPFKDALGHPLVTTNQYGPQSIDPSVFVDDDGTRYLYFGSGTGGLRVVKLNANMTSFSGTPTNISPSGASGVLEGSAMFKRNGTYYLQWSEGDTRSASYQVAYAHAASPTGPFTRSGVILKQDTALGILATGGSTVLAIPERDAYYMVYHRFKISGGDGTHREICIDPLFFNSDGTIAPVKPTLQGLQTAVSP